MNQGRIRGKVSRKSFRSNGTVGCVNVRLEGELLHYITDLYEDKIVFCRAGGGQPRLQVPRETAGGGPQSPAQPQEDPGACYGFPVFLNFLTMISLVPMSPLSPRSLLPDVPDVLS